MDFDFKAINLKSFYSTTGNRILREVISPLLQASQQYDRLTGYFSVNSLVSVASGLENLYRSNGRMRLVIGIHDIDADLIAARELGNLLPNDVVQIFKSRFLDEVGKLSELTERSAIAGIAWMLRLGLVEIRIAAPKNPSGIYHQKRMIFKDSNSNVVAGTGSLNETIGGLYNVEEMQFSFSWKGDEDLTLDLVNSFEEIWSGKAEDIDTVSLDSVFASEIIQTLGNLPNPYETNVETASLQSAELMGLMRFVRSSPSFAPYNLSNAALYPHQERVFSEALSRWPIRVMLADEVGLGKTLEAGILISYMVKMNIAERVTILCPAGLMRQWQEEMKRHFELNFHYFDSGRNQFVSPDKTRIDASEENCFDTRIKFKLISAQWARLNESRFQQDLPDLLLVDEAHAARVSINQYGTKTTRLWQLLDSVKEEIPHVVLLTATPMQVHASEYHGLLKILGLPKQWQKFSNYEESLKVISGNTKNIGLNEAKTIADLLWNSFNEFSWLPDLLTNQESVLIMELRQAFETSKTAPAIKVQQNLKPFVSILTKIHPGHFLTCRNTKSGLEKFGYKFPLRKFESPMITMSGSLERYELAVESYLSNAYGKTEESLKPQGKFPIGFAKSGYYQRLVSSLYASKSSLDKRKSKLSELMNALQTSNNELISKLMLNFDIDDDEIQQDDYQEMILSVPNRNDLGRVLANVKSMINLEISYIDELLGILSRMGNNIEEHDPKFAKAMGILESTLSGQSVLVFSRYTDTLEGFLKLFEKHAISRQIPGFALYTGGSAWIKTSLGKFEATKSDVTDALNANRISIVFCSDAASEGLNLQAARTLINLDVPWNPARLEQRIGRIARLGQKASEVEIYNLWYPESIEAKMYTRLLSRKSDYELAVGEAADIFAEAIKREIAAKFDGNQSKVSNHFAQLQEVRDDFQRIALQKIWQRSETLTPASTEMRKDLLQVLEFVDARFETSKYSDYLTAQPGLPNSFTLLHPALDEIATRASIKTSIDGHVLSGVFINETLFALVVIDKNAKANLLNVLSFGRVLQAILGMTKLERKDFFARKIDRELLATKLRQYLLEQVNIPNHAFARVPFNGIVSPNQEIDFEKIEIRDICQLEVDSL
jgi:superfamily II DNA or RNA helicase